MYTPGTPNPAPPPPHNRRYIYAAIAAGAAGVLLVVCAAGAALVSATGNNDYATFTENEEANEDETTDDAQKEPNERAEQPASMGDTVEDGNFEFVVTDFEEGVGYIGDEFFEESAQGEFAIVYVTVTNIGDTAEYFMDLDQKLFDAEGREHSVSDTSWIIEENEMLWEEINPGNSADAQLVFDIPAEAEADSVQLFGSAMSPGVSVRLS